MIEAVTAVEPTKPLNWRITASSSDKLAKPPANTAPNKTYFNLAFADISALPSVQFRLSSYNGNRPF